MAGKPVRMHVIVSPVAAAADPRRAATAQVPREVVVTILGAKRRTRLKPRGPAFARMDFAALLCTILL